MTDKQIIYDCPHVSFTDWGTYACKLYDSRDKNCLVKGGNCDSNISCPYKQLDQLKAENDELKRLIAKQKNAKIQLSKLKDKQYKEFCDMKQTLTEIKEIIHFNKTNRLSGGADISIEQILQKISEVNQCENL